MSSQVILFITHYSYYGLYLVLGVSILGIPLPDEFIMTYVGFLTYVGKLNPVLAIASAAVGSMSGITLAYWLGRLFHDRVQAYLERHAGGERLEKVLHWYHRQGGKLLTAGYFIPGVRHLSGYVAGLSGLPYPSFAFFAYLGAALWTTVFIFLGRLLGSRWQTILPIIHHYALLMGIGAILLSLAFYLFYKNRVSWSAGLYRVLKHWTKKYMSLGKRRFVVAVGSLSFVTLFIILAGLIQDFVAQEVGQFDHIVAEWLEVGSPLLVIRFMQGVNALGTHVVIGLVFVAAILVFYHFRRNWSLVLPLILAWGGGTLIDRLFQLIFRGVEFSVWEDLTPFQAPSSGFLLGAISFYAVLGYVFGRERGRPKQVLILTGEVILLTLLGISPVYLRLHPPSATVTGWVVSLLWTLVCVFIYEFWLYRREDGASVS
ncbi:inner membrane protein YqjA [Peptococcaceae bacterium CEB3]|nr:inner membrane protein YqjA [Peptococcaceae bacterium CEB3]